MPSFSPLLSWTPRAPLRRRPIPSRAGGPDHTARWWARGRDLPLGLRLLPLCGLVVSLGLRPSPLPAQRPSAMVEGLVRSTAGEPLGDAIVVILGGDSTRTGPDGRFRLRPPSNTQSVFAIGARRIGYRPATDLLSARQAMGGRDTLIFELDLLPQSLDPVRVQAKADAAWRRDLRRYTWVQNAGTWDAVFLEQDLTDRGAIWTSDLLRTIPGFRVSSSGGFRTRVVSTRGNCAPALVLDGMPMRGWSIDDIPVNDLKAVFVARGIGASGAWMLAGLGNGNCGVIALYTK